MSPVASETPVQSHSLPLARAASARPSQANAGISPFASLIEDSPPPPAQDRASRSQADNQDAAAQPPAQAPAEDKRAQPADDGQAKEPAAKQATDNGKATDKSPDQKAAAESESKADDVSKADNSGKTDDTVKLDPQPTDGEKKEADKADKADGDERSKTEAGAKPPTAAPQAPDPTAAQNTTQPTPAPAQATAAAAVAAAAQGAASADPTATDGDDASKAKTSVTVLASVGNVGGPAAKQGVPSGQPAPAAPQAQVPETQDPAPATADAKPAPAPVPDNNDKATDQKPAATARSETSARAQRFSLPEAAGHATANTQNTPAPSATTIAQSVGAPTPVNQTTQPAAAAAAATVTQAPPAAPVPLSGVAVAIAARANAGKNNFSIRLDPPELGRVDVRLSVDKDGHITSHLVADRKDTLALLQRDAAGLQRTLEDAGFKTADNGLQFSLRDSFADQQQQQQANGDGVGHIVLNEETPAAEAIPSGYGRYLGRAGGVDIRV